MAIESLRDLEFSIKSDIWALGVTAWEVFTLCSIPYPGLTYSFDFIKDLEAGMRLSKPDYASNEMYSYLQNVCSAFMKKIIWQY